MNFNTKTIHGGQKHEEATGSVMPPIFQTSTYAQSSPGQHKGYEYSRAANPTRTALENNFAAIENCTHGFAFSSGLSAIDCVLKMLSPGDEVIATKLVWLETPTNPLMKIADIEKISEAVKAKDPNILIAVDNTFATPYLQQPLNLGADIVMHSATKYLGGHSDLVMGALMVKDKNLAEKLHFIQFAGGAIAGPMDAFLALRGIKTLHVRMQRHCENGRAIAEFLKNHHKVGEVYYPGFKDHPNHKVAKKQMRDFGGMVSFRLSDKSREAAFKFLENTRVFTLAESLGGVESLVNHPATMTHASIPETERIKIGVTDSLIRLSVGIEDINDLIDDLRRTLTL